MEKRNIAKYHNVIVPDDFWSRVIITSDDSCWEWKQATNTTGYGLYNVKSPDWLYERTGRTRCQLLAHRVAWYVTRGDIGTDDRNNHICHTCDNRKCCNPNHMFMGSIYDNVQDMIKKGRAMWQR